MCNELSCPVSQSQCSRCPYRVIFIQLCIARSDCTKHLGVFVFAKCKDAMRWYSFPSMQQWKLHRSQGWDVRVDLIEPKP